MAFPSIALGYEPQTFFIRPLPPMPAMDLLIYLQHKAAPVVAAFSSATSQGWEAAVAKVVAAACAALSPEVFKEVRNRVLFDTRSVSIETPDGGSRHIKLSDFEEQGAGERPNLTAYDVIALFAEVLRVNFTDTFEKLVNLFGTLVPENPKVQPQGVAEAVG